MTPYVKTLLAPDALETFEKAELIVDVIPNPAPGREPYRCHEIARVVCGVLRALDLAQPSLRVVDGSVNAGEHSWLAFMDSQDNPLILDVYAIYSVPQVQLHAIHWGSPARNYRPHHFPRQDIDTDLVDGLIEIVSGVLVETPGESE